MVASVHIIGVGMGNPATLTVRAREMLDEAQLVIGSARLIEALSHLGARKVALCGARRIAEELGAAPEESACVVMSGDVGFHSGTRALLAELEAGGAISADQIDCVCGISSVQYLAARLKRPWEDAFLASAHGTDIDVARIVATHETTFLIAGGTTGAREVCARLAEAGYGNVMVSVGERLSYPDERITTGRADELRSHSFLGLASLFIDNPHATSRTMSRANEPRVTPVPHLADACFVRGRVPMTKREVRALVVSRLEVRPTDTVWDVGAGTGSVSVEAAHAAWQGRVVAIERDEDACALVAKNAELLDAANVEVVHGEAPDALRGLPRPDCAFIGGTRGRLEAIVAAVLEANPAVRLCLTAITLETLASAIRLAGELDLADLDVCQVQVTRVEQRAGHQMLRSENPVFIVSARGGRRP